MSRATEILTLEADRWKVVGEETTDRDTPGRMLFQIAEAVCRQVAAALEAEDREREAA